MPTQKQKTVALLGLAASLAFGFILNVLACALYKVWEPIMMFVCYLLALGISFLFFRNASSSSPWSDGNHGVEDIGIFLACAMATFGFGLPVSFYHSGMVAGKPLIMTLVSGVLLYASLGVYAYFFFFKKDEDDPYI